MSIRKGFKKLTAIILAAAMAFPSSIASLADEQETVAVQGTFMDESEIPEGKNIVYFGATSLRVAENETIYTVPVYRTGSEEYLSNAETVTIHSHDISAIYKKDYLLLGTQKTETPNDKTLLEMVSKDDGELSEKTIVAEVASNSDAVKITEADAETAEKAAKEIAKANAAAGSADGLAMLKEQQTGKPTREAESSVQAVSLTEAVMAQLLPDVMSQIVHSCEQKIEFKPGETETQIRFRILNDDEAEGTEMFSLMMIEAEEGEPYDKVTLSVCIEDDEEAELSVLGFTKDSYSAGNGSVTVQVSREGALYSMASVCLKGRMISTDPETGEETESEQVFGEIVFLPYEETKEAELSLQTNAELELYDLNGAVEGERMTASVKYGEETVREGTEDELVAVEDYELLGGSRDTGFKIKINGEEYTVKSEKNANYGTIWKNTDPPLAVGIYVFPVSTEKKGWFAYGSAGDETDNKYAKYQESDKYAELFWSSMWMTDKGESFTEVAGSQNELSGTYYQYVIPEWMQGNSFPPVPYSHFSVWNTKGLIGKEIVRRGKFSKAVDNADAVRIINQTDNLRIRAEAVDNAVGIARPRVYFFGAVFMYKRFEVSSTDPLKTTYRKGKEKTDQTVPFQVSIKCGEEPLYSKTKRNIYANLDGNNSNMVFSTEPVYVNGKAGIYAHITGYKLRLSTLSKDKVTLNYPEDYFSWLEEKGKTGSSSNGGLDFSAKNIQKIKDSVTKYVTTVPFDAYFIAWIESRQKTVFDDGPGYYQTINFEPVYEKYVSKVTVLQPEGTKKGETPAASFNDPLLVAGQTLECFNGGDVIDLSASLASGAEADYVLEGFEYKGSKDTEFKKGTGTELFLEPMEDYEIRPLVSETYNRIEVYIDKSAEGIVTLENEVIPQKDLNLTTYPELEKHPELFGKTMLVLNQSATSLKEKLRVEPGKAYSINILVKQPADTDPDRDYVYIPTVYSGKNTLDVYSGQRFDMIGQGKVSDNKVYIGVKKVKKSELKTYDISGIALTAVAAIRADAGTKYTNPAAGYSAVIGNGQGVFYDTKFKRNLDYVKTIKSDVETDGRFRLEGVVGVPGDKMTFMMSNGIADGQIVTVELKSGTDNKIDLGNVSISYPLLAPRVSFIKYRYMDDANNKKVDLNSNTVRLFDDQLQLEIMVDRNGSAVEKVIVECLSPSSGVKKNYEVYAEKEDQTVYILRLPNLLNNFHNGDRFKISVVQKISGSSKGQTTTVKTELPKVESGLTCYVANEQILPKEYNLKTDAGNIAGKKADVPLLGKACGYAESGKLNITRQEWKDGKGYSVIVNLDTVLWETTNKPRTTEEKWNAAKTYYGTAWNKADARKDKIEKEGKADAPEPGELANDVIAAVAGDQAKVDDLGEKPKSKENAEAMAKMTQDAKVTFSVFFCLDLEYCLNLKTSQYELCASAVTFSGTGIIDKTFYSILIKVPCYLNLNGKGNISYVMGGLSKKTDDPITSSVFSEMAGDIQGMLTNATESGSCLDVAFTGKIQIGVGVCNILGARGYIEPGFELQKLWNINTSNGYQEGFVLNGKGGVGVDLLFFSFNYNFINASLGFGSLENRTKVTLFNERRNIYKPKQSDDKLSADSLAALGELSGEEEEETVPEEIFDTDAESYWTGYSAGADISCFGSSPIEANELLQAQPVRVSQEVILTPAADRTRPQLVDLEDGRELLVFLAAGSTDDENTALYYSIRDVNGEWSAPEAVSDKESYQLQSSVLKKDDKIYIAWLEAGPDYRADAGKAEKLSSLVVRMTALTYDSSTGQMGEEKEVIDICALPYMTTAVSLTENNGRIFCSYMLTDYSKAETDEDLTDLQACYTTGAVTEVDADTMEIIPYKTAKGSYDWRLIRIEHPTLNDPLVLDSMSEALTVGTGENERELLVSAYTVNSPNATTDEAKELFLRIEDVTGGELKSYYPIRLTDNSVGEAFPTLTQLNGELYLTWISGGSDFHLMNVTDLLKAFFDPEYEPEGDPAGSEKVRQSIRIAFLNADPSNASWYKKTADELGLSEEMYESSLYERLCGSSFSIEETGIGCEKIGVHNITNHQLVSDGKDIYVLYTDLTADEGNNGVELYGMRYTAGSNYEEDTDPLAYEDSGFSDSVRISNTGLVMDELSAFMTEDRQICVASNFFEQSIGEDGKMAYGPNALVHTVCKPVQSVKIKEDEMQIPEYLVPGTTDLLSFEVINNGLLPAEGFSMLVTAEAPDGTVEVLEDVNYEKALGVNESIYYYIPWEVPESAEGTVFRVLLTEKSVSDSEPYELEASIPEGERLELGFAETYIDDDARMHVKTTVKNSGNRMSEPSVLRLSSIISDPEGEDTGYETQEVAAAQIPALAAGENLDAELVYSLNAESFTYFGKVAMVQELLQKETVLCTNYPDYVSLQPVVAEIEEGKEVLRMNPGTTKQLSVEIAPWEELCGDLEFMSLDPTVAGISENGTVTALKEGRTKVAVYDPVNYIYGDIEIEVTGTDAPLYDDDDSGNSGEVSLPSWVEKGGNWNMSADGSWKYILNGKPVTDRWVCIYNPYADRSKGQKAYSWFHFDKDGWMQTGWLDDKDGNRYYLSPVSDGTKGYMAVGWKKLDGKWYYFSEAEGSGYYGALQKNTTTPDGYKVDKNGVWVK